MRRKIKLPATDLTKIINSFSVAPIRHTERIQVENTTKRSQKRSRLMVQYTDVVMFILFLSEKWCPHTDSNRGPTDYKLHGPCFHRIAWVFILLIFLLTYSNITSHSIAWRCIKAYAFCNPYVTQGSPCPSSHNKL